MTIAQQGADHRVLLVEDDYLIADDMARALEGRGLEVVGPVDSVEEAIQLIESGRPLDGAVLDINLHGDTSFPLADALAKRGVPFVFATGYSREVIPERFAQVKRCEKPVEAHRLATALFG